MRAPAVKADVKRFVKSHGREPGGALDDSEKDGPMKAAVLLAVTAKGRTSWKSWRC